MAPHVPESRLKLGYPLYAADFDPLNPDFLLVGGGGGSSSTGVSNKISLLDVSRPHELTEVTDIELAKDEDSVTTLAVASSSSTSLTAIAGINGSLAEQQAGRNEHLRSFRISLPARKGRADGPPTLASSRSPPPSQALGKTALFTSAHGPRNETYQRVLRACPVQSASEARMAAIASGLAPENEVIVFQPVSNALTSTVDEISRIPLPKKEAADVDLMAIGAGGHVLAYCTDDSVYVQQLPMSKGVKIDVPVKIYQSPATAESTSAGQRAKFRALRFLTPKYILLLWNRPARTGAALLILKINITGNGHITLTKRLHNSIKLATGLDACVLRSPGAENFQAIVSVASQDSSIELLTIDYTPTSGLSTFRPYTLLKNVHSGPLTRLTFSNFIAPPLSVEGNNPVQRVKLASVGVNQLVVVHTLPLRLDSPRSKTPRYVLHPPGRSETLQSTISLFTALVVVIVAAFFIQAFCEIRGFLPSTLGAVNILPTSIRDKIAISHISSHSPPPAVSDGLPEALSIAIEAIKDAPLHIPTSIPTPSLDDLPPIIESATDKLTDLISSATDLPNAAAIVMRDTGSDLSAEIHHDASVIKEEVLKKWEDLTPKEKRGWKEKLKGTGHWVEQQGENVLKGILFSELAGVVGEAFRN